MDEAKRKEIEERVAVTRKIPAFTTPHKLADDAEWLLLEVARLEMIESSKAGSRIRELEKLSTDRNEARLAGLREISELKARLEKANAEIERLKTPVQHDEDLAIKLAHVITMSALGCLRSEDPSLVVARAILSELASMPVDLPSAEKIQDMLDRKGPAGTAKWIHDQLVAKTAAFDWHNKYAHDERSAAHDVLSKYGARMLIGERPLLAKRLEMFFADAMASSGVVLPSEKELLHAFIDAHPTTTSMNERTGIGGVHALLRTRLAPLLITRKIESPKLPAIEHMIDWFNRGYHEGHTQNGIRVLRDELMNHLCMAEQKPTMNVEAKCAGLWEQFKAELHQNNEVVSDRPITMTDLRTLIRLIDR